MIGSTIDWVKGQFIFADNQTIKMIMTTKGINGETEYFPSNN